MNIATWLARRALRSPDTPAIFDGFNCVVTYETFEVRVRAVAHWLKRQGVSAGDRVAIFMENAPEYLFVQYGAWYAGAVIVPINAKLHAKEARWIIENSEAVLTISSAAKVTALIEAKALGEIVLACDNSSSISLTERGCLEAPIGGFLLRFRAPSV